MLYLSDEVVGLKEGLNRGWAWAPGRLISGWWCRVTGIGAARGAWTTVDVTWCIDWLAVSVDVSSRGSSTIASTVLAGSTRAACIDSKIGAIWGFLDLAALTIPSARFDFLVLLREVDLC